MIQDAETQIVIVGAGFAGAATAWHLFQRGYRDITIIEKEAIAGVHSSGRNAAIVRTHADDPEEQRLVAEGADELRKGRLSPFHRNGIVLVNMGDDPIDQRFPRAAGSGRWCDADGTVDAAALLRLYLDGQDIRFRTRLISFDNEGGCLRVETDRGTLRCDLLVNAAGPWAGEVGGLPMTPMNRHLFQTTPLDWVKPTWPTVWDGKARLYFRPESGGLLMCCCDETPAEPGDYREDPAMLEELHDKIQALQPGLGELAIRSQWVGQRTFAPDRKFVIGFDPRNERVFHVAGLGGHGVTGSYAIGRLAADLIAGEPRADGEGFSPRRLFARRKPAMA